MARNTSLSLRNAVIYQIFTRNYKGGTFQAVEADLDRIQALGADIIYLLPVQPSGTAEVSVPFHLARFTLFTSTPSTT